MPICSRCEDIPAGFFLPSPSSWLIRFSHHPSFKSLESAAQNGCNVCSLIYQSIYDKRHMKEYPCAGTAGPDAPPPDYKYFGPPEYVVGKDGHRTYMSIFSYRDDHSKGGYHCYLQYKIGRSGMSHEFDLEFSDDPESSTLYPRSDNTFNRLNQWHQECATDHGECNIKYDPHFKPTRLIDVGKPGTSPCLILTGDSKDDCTKYLTLSHRWGSSMPESGTTKISTISRRLSKLPMKSLPRTFQDAIVATRKLNFRYIWIDSLCIIQDSPTDWQQESALMGKVYSHCYCMLAAAASVDSNGGLFPSRSELPIISVTTKDGNPTSRTVLLKRRFHNSEWDDLFKSGTLNDRGWTLQERELSPRILYFTKHSMLFECKEALGGSSVCSQSLKRSLDLLRKDSFVIDSSVRRVLDKIFKKVYVNWSFSEIQAWRYGFWLDMVEGYCARHLSVKTDKFPGVSGLASEYSFILNDRYVAGLWRNDLCRGLSWSWLSNDSGKFGLQRPKVQTTFHGPVIYGPSWSWAKMEVPISYDLVRERANISNNRDGTTLENPEFLNVSIVPAGRDPNGTLISGEIRLRGQLIPMSVSKSGNFKINGESLAITWDFLPQTPHIVQLLSLGSIHTGLVLLETERNDMEFRRVGIVSMIQDHWFDTINFKDLTLV